MADKQNISDARVQCDLSTQERFSRFRNRIPQKVLVFDGAMGTNLLEQNLPEEAYGGYPQVNEILNLSCPDAVRRVHEGFLKVGCDIIETNTFQANRLRLDDHGLCDKTIEINIAAADIARVLAAKYEIPDHPRFVAGSIGPLSCLPSSGDPSLDTVPLPEIIEIFYEQAKALIIGTGSESDPGGVDVLIVETGQDLLQFRQAVFAVDRLGLELGLSIPLIVQMTLDSGGRTLFGSDIRAVLACFCDLSVDIIGLNCSTGPTEMRESARFLGEYSPKWVSIIPNAGLPFEKDGKLEWPLTPDEFASELKELVGRFKVSMVGGCCGTKPEHIAALVAVIDNWKPAPRPKWRPRFVSSPLQTVDLDEVPRPVIVGERTNAQGSKKAKKAVLADDIDALFSLAQEQVNNGASILDINLATSERADEADLMRRVVTRITAGVAAPVSIDTTDPDVVAAALERIPGRAIINSINLEGGEDRARRTLELAKRYGSYVICLTIDESGMAIDVKAKRQIARRIAILAKSEFDIEPDRLIFDPLTFTLASGDEKYRKAATQTLEGLREIKKDLPESLTVLGISNCSYGLAASSREVLNSVFLYHAVRAGLDLAIVHAGQVVPYPAIHRTERKLAENLLFDREPDSLNRYVDYFEKKKAKGESRTHPVVNRPPDEGLRHAIIHREREGVELLIDKALNEFPPEKILNEILLPAMQEVGKKMADGELILPFVLQSAEVMKAAVARLESHMPQMSGKSRGKILLATVAGDVHDIGKNLVKTILQNNGYEVCDLGKQVPNSTIVGKAKEINPDIIGLSALLVTTSRQMEYCVEELQRAGLQIPVMIGGAAINRLFARRISWIGSDEIYKPGVYFANDAFSGLQITEGLLNPEERIKLVAMAEEGAQTYRNNHDKSTAESKLKKEVKIEAVSQVVHDTSVPEPPFWGSKIIGQVDIDEFIPLLDTKILFKLNWGIRGKTAEEYHSLIHSTFEPLLEDLLKESKRHSWLLPAVVYGYWPANSIGDEVIIYDPLDNNREVGRFGFPRQPNGERLCVADYFRPVSSGEKDVIALQVVTMGEKVSEVVRSFTQSGEYAKGFFLHGLAVEAAEALAEWLHRKIRIELEIERGQGHRYSFGYPSTPDLSCQEALFELLDAENAIGTRLTSAYQIVPEQSTSAFIVHHPDARYFHVEGEGLAAVLREPLD